MRKTILTLALLFSLVSCGPAFYSYEIERMSSTPVGVNPAGKSICVVADSLNIRYALEFCTEINKEYNNTVQLLSVVQRRGGISLKELMVDFAVKADCDIVIYIDKKINIYDTLDGKDMVMTFDADLSPVATARLMKPSWTNENYRLAVYEGRPEWVMAADKMDRREFQEAIDIWCGLLDTKNYVDKAALEANVATALYLLGREETARKWFQLSQKTAALGDYSSFKKKLNL